MFEDMKPVVVTGGSTGTLKSIVIDNNGSQFNSRASGTIDIKEYLPDSYSALTLDNFAVQANTLSAAHNGTQVTSGTQLLTYDSSTGILTRSIRVNRISIGGTYYYLHILYKIVVYYVE